MGTRALTVFKTEGNNDLVVMYRQFDGYPSGHGYDLYEFLMNDGKPRKVVQGYTKADEQAKAFNGMECLAAQCIGHFKFNLHVSEKDRQTWMREPIGNIYVYPAGSRNVGEEYLYELSEYGDDDGNVRVKVIDVHNRKVLYCGGVTDFGSWLDKATEEE